MLYATQNFKISKNVIKYHLKKQTFLNILVVRKMIYEGSFLRKVAKKLKIPYT